MTPFQIIVVRAREGRLGAGLNSGYFGGDSFQERLAFSGDAGARDKVRVTLAMLKEVALNPCEADERLASLRRGLVWLDFFGVCNPIPMFKLDEGSDELRELEKAVCENMASRMFAAAQRLLVWRSATKKRLRERQEELVVEGLRESLNWPVFDRSKVDQSAWRAEQDMLLAMVGAKRMSVRNRRSGRITALARATAPRIGSWTELLELLADKALGQVQ